MLEGFYFEKMHSLKRILNALFGLCRLRYANESYLNVGSRIDGLVDSGLICVDFVRLKVLLLEDVLVSYSCWRMF